MLHTEMHNVPSPPPKKKKYGTPLYAVLCPNLCYIQKCIMSKQIYGTH